MPTMFVMTIIFAVLALIATLVWRSSKRKVRRAEEARSKAREERDRSTSSINRSDSSGQSGSPVDIAAIGRVSKWVTVGLWALTLVLLFSSSFNIVSTKNVGIPTSFGKPVGSLENGPHFLPPWYKVTELDAAIQTDRHNKEDECIEVRIAGQAGACTWVTIAWRIKQPKADSLFQDFRDFENIRSNLVDKELISSLGAVMDSYDPLGVNDEGESTAPSLADISRDVKNDMITRVADRIDVISVSVTLIDFENNVDDRINDLQAQVAATRVAVQSKLTAEAQALANQALAASVSNDPNVLVAQCFDLVELAINNEVPPPAAGYGCWPGGSSAIVVPSAPR